MSPNPTEQSTVPACERRLASNVLIAVADETYASALSDLLKADGHGVGCVTSCAQDALAYVQSQPPDLAILGTNLDGGLDGIGAAVRTRERAYVPIILLAPDSDSSALDRALSVGPDAYLPTSISWDCLRANIAIALARGDAEEAKRESEELFRALFDAAPFACNLMDDQGRLVKLNKAACESWTGFQESEVLGKSPEELGIIDTPSADRLRALLVNNHGKLDRVEAKISLPTVGPRYLLVSVRIIQVGSKSFTLSASADITDIKLAEEALQQSEQNYRQIFNGTSDALLIFDAQGRIVDVNERLCEMFGYDRASAVAKSLEELSVGRQFDAAPSPLSDIGRAITDGPQLVEWNCRRNGGDVFWCEVGLRACTLAGELRVLGSMRDITDRKRTEQELHQYRQHLEDLVQSRTDELSARNLELQKLVHRAEEASQAKSVFLSNMSHELRTPLNAILGFASIVARDSDIASAHIPRLASILRAGEHLLTLINDVLELAKIESGKVDVELSDVNLEILVAHVLDMLRDRAEARGLSLTLDTSSRFPTFIRTDASKIRQILINLVGNAIKFTDAGHVVLRLGQLPSVVPDGSAPLWMEVEDSGSGIAPEDLERVFKPFERVTHHAATEGTGLGLPIARNYVEALGGRMTARSTPGGGSTFRVELPFEETAHASAGLGDSYEDWTCVLSPGLNDVRVLVVEDQPDNQVLMRTILESAGLRVRVASSGEDAIKIFEEWNPNFVWMDQRLPGMSGIEATKAMRAMKAGKETPIVGLTASVFLEERAGFIACGLDDVVCKPFRPRQLFDVMSRLMGIEFGRVSNGETGPSQRDRSSAAPGFVEFGVLPNDVILQLRAAILALDPREIDTVIDRVEALESRLGQRLRCCAARLEYGQVLESLEACIAKQSLGRQS